MSRRPHRALALHGGAGAPDLEEYTERQAAVERSLEVGWAAIESGALQAVIAAVRAMEDEPMLNAGIGACLNSEGLIELDAGVMEGGALKVGAVGAVRDVRHPIDLARAVMEDGRHVLLVGEGASAFARKVGVETCQPQIFETERQRHNLQRVLASADLDTVGAVARDAQGHLAVAVSTGGRIGKLPGRIGDSPVPGAGFYADDRAGAVCGTGEGEGFLRLALCHRAVSELESGDAPAAVALSAVEYLARRSGSMGGVIVLGLEGVPAHAYNTAFMPMASRMD